MTYQNEIKNALEFVGIELGFIGRYVGTSTTVAQGCDAVKVGSDWISIYDFRPDLKLDHMYILENGLSDELRYKYMKNLLRLLHIDTFNHHVEVKVLTTLIHIPSSIRWEAFKKLIEGEV